MTPLEESHKVPVQPSPVNAEKEGLTTTNGTAAAASEGAIDSVDVPESSSMDFTTKASDKAGAAVVVEDEMNVNIESVAAGEHPVAETAVNSVEEQVAAAAEVQAEVLEDKEPHTEAINEARESLLHAVTTPAAEFGASDTKEPVEKEEEPINEHHKKVQIEMAEAVGFNSSNLLSEDGLPVERGIDDSPSDELGPPDRAEDVKADVTGTECGRTVLEESAPALKNDLPLEFHAVDTKPSEASTVVFENVTVLKKSLQKLSAADNKEVSFEKVDEEMKVEKPGSAAPSLSFAKAFGSSANKPPPIQTSVKEMMPLLTQHLEG